jgi:hypothetical protein
MSFVASDLETEPAAICPSNGRTVPQSHHPIHRIRSSANSPRILNRDLRPVFQHACPSSHNAAASAPFISGVPYALDTYYHFGSPVYPVFSRSNPFERYLGRVTDSLYDQLTYPEYHSQYSADPRPRSSAVHPDACEPGHFVNERKGPFSLLPIPFIMELMSHWP